MPIERAGSGTVKDGGKDEGCGVHTPKCQTVAEREGFPAEGAGT